MINLVNFVFGDCSFASFINVVGFGCQRLSFLIRFAFLLDFIINNHVNSVNCTLFSKRV